jgi:arsenite methyltransferase
MDPADERHYKMNEPISEAVRTNYAAVARSGLSSQHDGVRLIAEAFGYSAEELDAVPAEANLGLSCGNPGASASLRPGEVVVDLGCGGGFDVLLAARRVGPTGKAIGIDMTSEMVELARRNAGKQQVANAIFHQATIDDLPLAAGSVDCVISNCVVNLAPDKQAVFREIYRVLKPGGRVAISDIALKKPLPEELVDNLLAYVGCIAGAIPIETYIRGLVEAGFQAVRVVDTKKDLRAYENLAGQGGCCTPITSDSGLPVVQSACHETSSRLIPTLAELCISYDLNDFAASVQVCALKSTAGNLESASS